MYKHTTYYLEGVFFRWKNAWIMCLHKWMHLVKLWNHLRNMTHFCCWEFGARSLCSKYNNAALPICWWSHNFASPFIIHLVYVVIILDCKLHILIISAVYCYAFIIWGVIVLWVTSNNLSWKDILFTIEKI